MVETCKAITKKNNERCKKKAIRGTEFCYFHSGKNVNSGPKNKGAGKDINYDEVLETTETSVPKHLRSPRCNNDIFQRVRSPRRIEPIVPKTVVEEAKPIAPTRISHQPIQGLNTMSRAKSLMSPRRRIGKF